MYSIKLDATPQLLVPLIRPDTFCHDEETQRIVHLLDFPQRVVVGSEERVLEVGLKQGCLVYRQYGELRRGGGAVAWGCHTYLVEVRARLWGEGPQLCGAVLQILA